MNIQHSEDVATALLDLLQKEKIEVVIDEKILTGKEALKLRVDKIMKGKFQYRERKQNAIDKIL